MDEYTVVDLRGHPQLKERAAEWFSGKWGIPKDTYLGCMDDYIGGATGYGWYVCLCGDDIAGGLGVVENDSHDRPDLAPNICAVYTEEPHRGKGIAGKLLCHAVNELRAKGISPVYLVTDHTGFYERYGWEFLCEVRSHGEEGMSRMYIHK